MKKHEFRINGSIRLTVRGEDRDIAQFKAKRAGFQVAVPKREEVRA